MKFSKSGNILSAADTVFGVLKKKKSFPIFEA